MASKQNLRLEKMQNLADVMLQKLQTRVEATDPMEMNLQSMKHISATLKDLKDIQMLRSPADTTEQELKIKNLQRQVREADDASAVSVEMAPELEEYSG